MRGTCSVPYVLCCCILWTIQRGKALEQDKNVFPSQVQRCSKETGGGICPLQNTCCRVTLPAKNDTTAIATTTSGCIPSDLGPLHATCCPDQQTGCGVGYQCSSSRGILSCIAGQSIADPLVQRLPRYSLCRATSYSNFQQVLGFSSPALFHSPTTRMLYYSSHPNLRLDNGDHDSDSSAQSTTNKSTIRMVLIVIHGANRNADDYFCAAAAAIQRQRRFRVDQILLLAPRFVVSSDLPDNTSHSYDTVLQWDDTPDGPWRYGASAIRPPSAQQYHVSSFDVLDAMIQSIQTLKLPQLEHITVAGHSSGGQFVQRWALISPHAGNHHDNGVPVRLVVANPSSFAYLIPERYNATTNHWFVPNQQHQQSCPDYNQWEWGLETSKDTPVYVRNVLEDFDTASLVERFVKRQVAYLAGSLDRCNVSSSTSFGSARDDNHTTLQAPWCNSHGLEVTCADELQGSNRWARHERYIQMLRWNDINVTAHYQKGVVVPGVGHDHSLMFSSPQGLQAIFGDDTIISEDAVVDT